MKVTANHGELQQHRILERILAALSNQEFSLTILFPTLSLLNTIQDELISQPEINGIGGVRFLLFEGFITEVASELGLSLTNPSPLEQELTLSETLTKMNDAGSFKYLNQVPFNASYRQTLQAGIQEWKRSRLQAEPFSEWARQRSNKLQELALLYQTYQNLLIQKGYREPDQLLLELESCDDPVRRGKVILYGFTDLTPLQRDLIRVLEAWFEFEALLDPTVVPEFQELMVGHFKFSAVTNTPPVEPGDALRTLQSNFWTSEPQPGLIVGADNSLQLLQASGQLRQAGLIAREIKRLLTTNDTLGIGDFLILSPQPQQFTKTAAPIFLEYQLPLAASAASVREFPAISRFRQLFTTAAAEWQWPEMELMIRQFYDADLARDGDRLLLWLTETHGALSGQQRWLALMADPALADYASTAKLDLGPLWRALKFLPTIPTAASLESYLDLIAEWFSSKSNWGGLRPKAIPEISQETLLNYQAIQAVIQTIETLQAYFEKTDAAKASYSLQQFLDFCEEYLFAIEIQTTQHRVQVIKALSPREARGLKAKVVFITGLEQGSFPRAYINDWKLTLRDRLDLKRLGVDLETGAHFQVQEKLAFYWGLQAAAAKLYLVYQDQDQDGQPRNRSVFLEEVLEWFPELAERVISFPLAPSLPRDFDACYSPAEVERRLVGYLSANPAQVPSSELEQCNAHIEQDSFQGLIQQVMQIQTQSRQGRGFLGASPELAQIIGTRFGPDYSFAITAVEDYRTCPFRFLLKHILRIRPAPKARFLPEVLDLGNLYHQILQEFGAANLGQVLKSERVVEYNKLLDDSFQKYFNSWQEQAPNDLARLVLTIQESLIRLTLNRWLQTELDWAKATKGRFHLHGVEVEFGKAAAQGGLATLSQPFRIEQDGTSVKIWGRIDRIDATADGSFAVYDYKTGRGPATKDLLELERLQIPVYLMALEQLCFGAGKAVGGSYLGLRQPSRSSAGVWQREQLGLAWRGKGLLTTSDWEDWFNRVRNELITAVQGIRSGQFGFSLKDCPSFCEYASGCRRCEGEGEGPNEFTAEPATG